MKKLISALLVAALLLTAAACAEGAVGPLFDSAVQLAFGTSNVTLGAEATFTYEGEVFKTMHASYKQDSDRSVLSYMLDPPRADGTVYTGGYTVVGIGNTAYSAETYYGNYVCEYATAPCETVLTYDARKGQMLAAARSLAVFCEELVGVKQEENSYSFSIGDLPEFADRGVYYLVMKYIEDYYYRDMFGVYRLNEQEEPEEEIEAPVPECYYEDYDALINNKYFAIFGKNYDPDAGDDYGKYEVALSAVYQIEQEACANCETGFCLIKADGSVQLYETREDVYRAMGYVITDCEDYFALIKDYCRKAYGEELTDEMIDVALYSPNYELNAAYTDVYYEAENELIERARAVNPDAVYVYQHADGTIDVSDTLPGAYYGDYSGPSVTSVILGTLDFAEMKKLECVITTDDNGLLSTFSGKADFETTDVQGEKHTLSIEFTLTAADYGITHVNEEFSAEEYGMKEYGEGDEYDYDQFITDLVNNAPATITLGGREYDTQMELLLTDYGYDEYDYYE